MTQEALSFQACPSLQLPRSQCHSLAPPLQHPCCRSAGLCSVAVRPHPESSGPCLFFVCALYTPPSLSLSLSLSLCVCVCLCSLRFHLSAGSSDFCLGKRSCAASATGGTPASATLRLQGDILGRQGCNQPSEWCWGRKKEMTMGGVGARRERCSE